MSEYMDNNLDLIAPINWATSNDVIKVIGVGGGGCNAVDYMYRQNVEGCSFIVCNTDARHGALVRYLPRFSLAKAWEREPTPALAETRLWRRRT